MPHKLTDLTDRSVADAKKQLRTELLRCVAAVSPTAARETAARGLTLLDVVTLATRHGALPLSGLPPDDPSSEEADLG